MATTTRLHGSLPAGVRDHHGVLGENQTVEPQARLAQARAKVAQLEREHEAARETFSAACDDDGQHDFNALKANVSRLARELAEGEDQVSQWENVVAQSEKANAAIKFGEKVKEARAAKKRFTELYRAARLELEKWHSLGVEVDRLATTLADRLPNGTVYYRPELKNVAGELQLQTATSLLRYLVNCPIEIKGE